jgi:hypothetical protein
MQEYILQENVLSDNTMYVADEGKIFKGGYIAIIKEYTFQNTQCDRLSNIYKFRSKERLLKFLSKKYPNFDDLIFY